jgi:hypothetical protein
MALGTCDWDALRQMRIAGQKPSLPVIVTTLPQLPKRLEGVGCLVILHKAGEAMPIKLLDGLDVIFYFRQCDLMVPVWKLAKSKDVTFASARTWCSCSDILSVVPMWCDSWAAGEKFLNGEKASA